MDDDLPSNDTPTVKELVFCTDDADYPLVELTNSMDVSVTVLDWIQSTEGACHTSWFLAVSTADADEVLQLFRERERTVEAVLLDQRADECLLEVTVTDSVSQTIGNTGALYWSIRAERGEVLVTVLVPPTRDPEVTAEAIRHRHPSLTLTSVVTHPVERAFLTRRSFQHLLRGRLTERQWQVLRLAYEGGYFERPREETQSDIAAELGISQETVSQHLRAAQRRLLRVVFDDGLQGEADGEPTE